MAKKAETTDTNETGFDLVVDTLMGDVRDALLGQVRNLNRPWSMLTEGEQRELANTLERASRNLVEQTVRVLEDYEYPTAVVSLGEIKIVPGDKARIEAKIAAANIEVNRNALGDHSGDRVVLLMADPETFMGERAPADVQPDQSDMDLPGDTSGGEAA